jgi:hypothetical protein
MRWSAPRGVGGPDLKADMHREPAIAKTCRRHVREAEDTEVAIRTATECEVEVVDTVLEEWWHIAGKRGTSRPGGVHQLVDSQTSLSLRTTLGG